jgi:preprotein translocase subunit SecY
MPFVNSLLFTPDALFGNDSIFKVLTSFSGAAMDNASIFTMGLGPYISATILVQGLMNNVPRLKERLKTEGNSLITRYNLYATLPIAINSARLVINNIVLGYQSNTNLLYPNTKITSLYVLGIISLVAGTMFLVWLADVITEYGVGNGTSIIISAGILNGVPKNIRQISVDGQLNLYLITLLLLVPAIILVETALRKIPLVYPQTTDFSHIKKEQNFLPLKVNLAGIMPALFTNQALGMLRIFFKWLFKNQEIAMNNRFIKSLDGLETLVTVLLVILISYVYKDAYFRAEDIADRLQQKPVGMIPGVRPGKQTENYINRIANRLLFAGALYISAVSIFTVKLYVQLYFKTLPILAGTSILIVAVTSIDVSTKVGNQLISELNRRKIFKAAE